MVAPARFLYVRAMEVTDDVTRMAIDLIHRLQKRFSAAE